MNDNEKLVRNVIGHLRAIVLAGNDDGQSGLLRMCAHDLESTLQPEGAEDDVAAKQAREAIVNVAREHNPIGTELLGKPTKTPEGRRLYEQERTILELTELICEELEKQDVSRSLLAGRIDRLLPDLDGLLDGRYLLTVATASHIFAALDCSLHFSVSPLGEEAPAAKPMTVDEELRVARQRVLDAFSAITPLTSLGDPSPPPCTVLIRHACEALYRANEFLKFANKD